MHAIVFLNKKFYIKNRSIVSLQHFPFYIHDSFSNSMGSTFQKVGAHH